MKPSQVLYRLFLIGVVIFIAFVSVKMYQEYGWTIIVFVFGGSALTLFLLYLWANFLNWIDAKWESRKKPPKTRRK